MLIVNNENQHYTLYVPIGQYAAFYRCAEIVYQRIEHNKLIRSKLEPEEDEEDQPKLKKEIIPRLGRKSSRKIKKKTKKTYVYGKYKPRKYKPIVIKPNPNFSSIVDLKKNLLPFANSLELTRLFYKMTYKGKLNHIRVSKIMTECAESLLEKPVRLSFKKSLGFIINSFRKTCKKM